MRLKHPIVCAAFTLAVFVGLSPNALTASTKGRAVAPFTSEFKAGDYVWHPEVSPAGPVVIIVSLPDQVMYAYRNGVRIGRSTVSTGKPGKRTPTGVFTVLQKTRVKHLQGGEDAPYAAAHLEWYRDARRAIAGLSGVRRVRADARGLR